MSNTRNTTSTRGRRPFAAMCAAALTVLLASCAAVGPNYKRPEVPAPAQFKEIAAAGGATRAAKRLPDKWWELYADPRLNELETAAESANPQIEAAAARVQQARALARLAGANQSPYMSADPAVSRQRQSSHRPLQPGSNAVGYTANDFRVPLDVSYELDFFGRLQRGLESATASAEAEANAYETVRLGLHGDIAANYFAIREIDTEIEIVRNSIELYKQSLVLVRARFKGGITSELDVTRAQAELAATESQAIGLQQRRANFEYALAVLLGKTPAEFSLPFEARSAEPATVPPGLPSELLQRRPDIAQYERILAARSADIGVAQAQFLPHVTLTGGAGYESTTLSNLLKSGSLIGLIGGALSQPIFDGGRNQAGLDRAKAAYDEALAQYKLKVLTAFQEVETSLAGLRVLAEQSEAQARAVDWAQKTARISETRYKAGLVTYLDVIDAERSALSSQQLLAQLSGQRLAASVSLIKALGGGWQSAPEQAAQR
jgi:outer membrane protein, multidrug efflux system